MHLFFDLDGTLTDSSPGIIRCINHALGELGLEEIEDERLQRLIGAPLTTIFEAVIGCSDVAVLDTAVAAYRTRFNDIGIFENALFPGIGGALEVFQKSGHALQIVTAKPAVSARRVIEHFDVARFFDFVHGPALGDRACDKAALVGAALQMSGGARDQAVMIGDRAEDVLAARAQRIPAVAVGWGYGSRPELDGAGPVYVAESVTQLVQWVLNASGPDAPTTFA